MSQQQLLLGATHISDHILDNSVYGDGSTGYLQITVTTSATHSGLARIKRTKLGVVQPILDGQVYFNASDQLVVNGLTSTAVYRDPAAHLDVFWNASTAYVNGGTVTGSGTYATAAITNPRLFYDGTNFASHYCSEFVFWNGTSETLTGGQTDVVTGSWKPTLPSGASSAHTWLMFMNGAGLGDNSGTGGAWTKNGTVTQTTDSPTDDAANNIGNYCTWNPLSNGTPASPCTLAKGNRTISAAGAGMVKGTLAFSSGKYYFELTAASNNEVQLGIAPASLKTDTQPISTTGLCFYTFNGQLYTNGVGAAYKGSAWTATETLQMAVDMDNGKIWWGSNDTWFASGNPSTGANPGATFTPFEAMIDFGAGGGTAFPVNLNSGQTAFTYTPPTGFKRLSTANLPAPTIKKASSHFNAGLYTGTGATLNITGLDFQPDWVIIKSRSAAGSWAYFDAVRGATKYLSSDSTAAEVTDAASLTSFNADGFTLGTAAIVNTSAATYVYYAGNFNGAGVANTDGTISSTVSVNATAGQSIVKWTGTAANATVGHGLGAVPKFIITKANTQVTEWPVYHASLLNTEYMALNTTAAKVADATYWNSTTPTSSVFSLGSSVNTNNTNGMLAYCFAEVAGFSKFGSYVGNAAADGPFVWCGFRPKYILIKRTDVASDWYIWDTARNTYNVVDKELFANTGGAEVISTDLDINSNGFKCRSATIVNVSAGTYIFAAFAEFPFGGIGTAQGKAR